MQQLEKPGVWGYGELAVRNTAFRRTVVTGPHSQVVVMSLAPGEDIGEEVHEHGDQVLLFIEGEGEAVLEGEASPIGVGDMVFVPAGTLHNIVSGTAQPLKLVTVYAPPEHEPGTVHETKAEAEADEHH
jgi:mannose-6-phosphate isomerase-like protein (cupin superfamily)